MKKNSLIFLFWIMSFAFALEPAPTFFLTTLEGKNFFASEFYGSKAKDPKVTVISFFASWCGPCRKEIKALDSLALKYPQAAFYLINYKEDKDVIRNWLDQTKTPLPILMDAFGLTAKKFNVAVTDDKGSLNVNLPAMFIINKKGEMIYSHTGYEDKDAQIISQKLKVESGK